MKKISLFAACLALLVLVSAPLLDAQPGQQMCRLRVTLASESTVASAQILINGQAKGTVYRGRASDFILPFAQRATIRLINAATVVERQITLVPGRWVSVSIPMITQTQGTLRVFLDSGPATAQVFVDNAYKGVVSLGRYLTIPQVDAGTRQVRVKSGRLQQTMSTIVNANQTSDLRMRLQAQIRMGKLRFTLDRLSSVPRAQINIGGSRQEMVLSGNTYEWEVPVGTHTIRLSQGDLQETTSVTIRGGQTTPLTMTLRRPTGKISIQHAYNSAVQTARLYVNNTANSSISRGSNFVLDLEPGDYTLQLKNGNLKSEAVPVTLRDNQSVAVSLSVSKPKGFVTLTYSGESAHAWATIYIDGKQSDRIRRGQSKRFELDTGAHTFEVRAHRESAQQRLIVSARRERSLTLTIERKMGRLAVSLNANSSVSSAQITINGQSRGSITRGQTLTYDDMAPGTATVIMSANGMTEQGQTQITRGQTSSLTLTLKQQVGTLVVSLLPESRAAFARVLINGSYKFTVNRGQTRKLDLPAGVYTVILDGGRAPQTVQQVVEAGKVSQIVMNLQ